MTWTRTKKKKKTFMVLILDISKSFCVESHFPSVWLCLWGNRNTVAMHSTLGQPSPTWAMTKLYKKANSFCQLYCYIWWLQWAVLKGLTRDHGMWQLNIVLISSNPSLTSICLWLDYTSHSHNFSADGIKWHFV